VLAALHCAHTAQDILPIALSDTTDPQSYVMHSAVQRSLLCDFGLRTQKRYQPKHGAHLLSFRGFISSRLLART